MRGEECNRWNSHAASFLNYSIIMSLLCLTNLVDTVFFKDKNFILIIKIIAQTNLFEFEFVQNF